MKTNTKLLTIFLWAYALFMVGSNAAASETGKQDTRLTRQTLKSFKVSPNTDVFIYNKYGQVTVNTWQKDSVKIEVTVTAYGKDNHSVQNTMERVSFDFNNTGEFVTAKTVVNQSSNAIADFFNEIMDYSKSVFNKNTLKIDYVVSIPAKASLKVDNKFGDVFVGDIKGKCGIDLEHGSLKAAKLPANSSIKLNFGKADIREMVGGNLNINMSEIEIGTAGELIVESMGSELTLDTCTKLKINSKNDKMRVGQVGDMMGKSFFTKFKINEVGKNIDLELSFGGVNIQGVKTGFQSVNLNGKSSDIDLALPKSGSYSLQLSAPENKLNYPENLVQKDSTSYDSRNRSVFMKGKIGTPKDQAPRISVKSAGGSVYIQEFQGLSDKN